MQVGGRVNCPVLAMNSHNILPLLTTIVTRQTSAEVEDEQLVSLLLAVSPGGLPS